MHGPGTYAYADGDKYEGEWKDDKRHGKGTVTYRGQDGSIVEKYEVGCGVLVCVPPCGCTCDLAPSIGWYTASMQCAVRAWPWHLVVNRCGRCRRDDVYRACLLLTG